MASERALVYPAKLRNLYTKECVEYRKIFNDRMYLFIKKRLDNKEIRENSDFKLLAKENNLIVPYSSVLEEIENPFDMITTAAMIDGKPFILTEYHDSKGPYSEGIGKTNTFLKLLGVKIPYSEIPSLEEDVQSFLVRFSANNSKMKLIASDMIYIGSKDGHLSLAPVKGEELCTQWDLARHIFRKKDPKYFPGKQRDASSRKYLETIGFTYHIDPKIFSNLKKSYKLRNVFLIERKKNVNSMIVKDVPKNKTLSVLQSLLFENPTYHQSKFWDINDSEHKKRIGKIIAEMKSDLPMINKIIFPFYTNAKKEEELSEKLVENIIDVF